MNNRSTISLHQSGPYQAEMERYQAIVTDVETYLATLTTPLRAIAQPLFDKLVPAEFSQVVSLLPYWLSDIAPVAPDVSHQLGLAHFYFWWYYYIQDEMIDGDTSPAAILVGHLMLLKMVAIYEGLGVTQAPYWPEYQRLAQISAEAHAIELQTRFTALDELTPERLALLTLDFIAERVAPLFFNPMAQLHLAGLPANHPLHHDLVAALRCFSIARQLGDDASDWLSDLQAGQLNYVSAHLISRFYKKAAITNSDLDLERLTGYQLTDETFWNDIEQNIQSLNQQALDHLAPYGAGYLQGLIQHQMKQYESLWGTAKTQRTNLREIFGVTPLSP